MNKFFSINYKSWWEKVHGNLLENHMQFLVNDVGSTIDALQKNDEEVLIVNQSLVLKCRVGVPDKVKGPPNEKVQKEKCSTQTHQTSHKRPSQDKSGNTCGDRCWKRGRPPPEMLKDNDLHAAEITDSNVSSSRTLTAIKEPSNVNMVEAKPQDSTKSVEGLDSRKSFSMPLAGQEVTYISHDKTIANVEFSSPKHPVTCKSVFDGRKVVSELLKDFVKGAWTKFLSKLVDLNADRASSLKDEI